MFIIYYFIAGILGQTSLNEDVFGITFQKSN